MFLGDRRSGKGETNQSYFYKEFIRATEVKVHTKPYTGGKNCSGGLQPHEEVQGCSEASCVPAPLHEVEGHRCKFCDDSTESTGQFIPKARSWACSSPQPHNSPTPLHSNHKLLRPSPYCPPNKGDSAGCEILTKE